jgi:hypothetical protein
MSQSPILAVIEIAPTQSNKATTHNNAVRRLEAAANKPLVNTAVGAGPWTISEDNLTSNAVFKAHTATANFDIIVPATIATVSTTRIYVIINATTFHATVKPVGFASSVTVKAGTTQFVFQSGTSVFALGAPAGLTISDLLSTYAGKAYLPLSVNGAETDVEYRATYEVGGYFPADPGSNQLIMQYVAGRTFKLPIGLVGSRGYFKTVPTNPMTFDIRKNGSSIGSMLFAASTAVATFTFTTLVTFSLGDRLEIIAPITVDPTALDLSFTFDAYRDSV